MGLWATFCSLSLASMLSHSDNSGYVARTRSPKFAYGKLHISPTR